MARTEAGHEDSSGFTPMDGVLQQVLEDGYVVSWPSEIRAALGGQNTVRLGVDSPGGPLVAIPALVHAELLARLYAEVRESRNSAARRLLSYYSSFTIKTFAGKAKRLDLAQELKGVAEPGDVLYFVSLYDRALIATHAQWIVAQEAIAHAAKEAADDLPW